MAQTPAEDASTMLREEARLKKEDPIAQGALAEYLFRAVEGSTEEARSLFESVLDMATSRRHSCSGSKKKVYAYYIGSYAELCESTGDLIKAQSLYERGLEIWPECPLCLGNYPTLLERCKAKLDQTQAAYEEALSRHPSLISVRINYSAFLRHKRGATDRAEAELQRCLEIDPNHAEALATYAVFLHARINSSDQHDKVLRIYQRALKAEAEDMNSNTLSNLGLFYSEILNDAQAAKETYEKALQIEPDHANSCYNFAVLLDTHFKQPHEAKVLYERAIATNPKHAYALYNIAVLHEDKLHSPPDTVIPLYRRAVAAAPKGDALALADLGRYLAQQQGRKMNNNAKEYDFTEAEAFLNKALSYDPKCSTAIAALGEIALARNDIDSAHSHLNHALKTDASNVTARRLSGLLANRATKRR